MNKTSAVVIGACLSLLIAACGSEPNNEAKSEVETDQRHVWSEQTDTIDRAKEVEATLLKAAEEQRKALEGMED